MRARRPATTGQRNRGIEDALAFQPAPTTSRHFRAIALRSRATQGWVDVAGSGAIRNRPLVPGAYQHQVGRTGRQKRDRKHDAEALAGGLEHDPHDENIGRFYPGSLGDYFVRFLRGIQVSFTTQGLRPRRSLMPRS
jgi:hypothetical protein